MNDFNAYYQAVQRFAYEAVDRGQIARLMTYLSSAIDNAVSYSTSTKKKTEQKKVAEDAIAALREERNILAAVLGKDGIMSDDGMSRIRFEHVFRAGKSLLKKK